MPGMGGNTYSQIGFRGRNDDGSETTATWIAPENVNWSQRPDRNFRVRLKIENPNFTGNSMWLFFGTGPTGTNFGTGLANTVVTSGTPIIATTSTFYANGDDTTEQLAPSEFFPFIVDNNQMTEGTGISQSVNFDGESVETEWCLQIDGDSVVDGQILGLRAQIGSALFGNSYFEFPQITVDVPRTVRRLIVIQ